jgi:signal transduction histidine kinase
VQVFVNLLLNSIQAMASGGEIQVLMDQTDGSVNILFNDNGPGISMANRDRVFDPFFTTKPAGTGTGLGLSVSHAIVSNHGGTIEIVESRKGLTSIRVSLPLVSDTDGEDG